MEKNNNKNRHAIPRQLTEEQFNEYILPYLSKGARGPACKLSLHKIFNYILKFAHTGVQWAELPIEKDANGKPEIHYTRIFRVYQRWSDDGSLKRVFENSLAVLHEKGLLDLTVLHGDGSLTPAKKGGDLIGYNGHKKIKGETVLPVVDRNLNVLAPYTTAPANHHESPLLPDVINNLKENAKKNRVLDRRLYL